MRVFCGVYAGLCGAVIGSLFQLPLAPLVRGSEAIWINSRRGRLLHKLLSQNLFCDWGSSATAGILLPPSSPCRLSTPLINAGGKEREERALPNMGMPIIAAGVPWERPVSIDRGLLPGGLA